MQFHAYFSALHSDLNLKAMWWTVGNDKYLGINLECTILRYTVAFKWASKCVKYAKEHSHTIKRMDGFMLSVPLSLLFLDNVKKKKIQGMQLFLKCCNRHIRHQESCHIQSCLDHLPCVLYLVFFPSQTKGSIFCSKTGHIGGTLFPLASLNLQMRHH